MWDFPRTTALLLGAGLAAPLPTLAQQTSELDDVVVTAAGYEQLTKNAPASISVVSREELETSITAISPMP